MTKATVAKEIYRLRRSLRTLDISLRRLTPLLSAPETLNRTPEENGPQRNRRSAKARASLVLQGRYMGYMRQLKPRQKAQVRKIRETKGVTGAIVRAKELARAQRRMPT
jgi:hypothetical protein